MKQSGARKQKSTSTMGCDKLTIMGWVTGIAIGCALGLGISCSANQNWIKSDSSRSAHGGLWSYCLDKNNTGDKECWNNWELDDWLSQSKLTFV